VKKAAGVVAVALFLLTNCGGGSSAPGGSSTVTPLPSVAISSDTQQGIDQGQTVKFMASVTNDSNSQGVSWSVSGGGCSGNGCGTLTNKSKTAVTYNAPSAVSSVLSVTVKATSAAKSTVSASAVVNVHPPPAITTTSLPGGVVGTSYNATLRASGGMGPLSWSLAPGSSLPAGLSLNASTGVISGPPATSGTSNFTVQVTDSASTPLSSTQQLSIIVAKRLIVTTTLLPSGTVNLVYSATLQASGGTAPLSWNIASGSLPDGLSINASTGVISGTPTTSQISTFAVQVADSSMQTATQQLSITIDPGLTISTTALVDGTVNVAYSVTVVAAHATLPVAWSIVNGSGTLPSGLSLDASTGAISGKPTVAGTSNFTMMVTDSSTPPQTVTQPLSITINGSGAKNTELSGHYAFLLSGYDTHGNRMAAAGSFAADGSGGITSGVEDVNDTGLAPEKGLTFTGTYSLGADNRGTLTFTNSAGATYTMAFAVGGLVAGTAEKGSAVEFDASGYLMSGVIEWQNSAAFLNASVKGNYAFSFTGSDMAGSRMAVAGQFTADGSGRITGGVFDADDNGTPATSTAIANSSTYNVDASSGAGRGTATLNGISPAPVNYAFYIVSTGKMLVLSTDTASTSGLVTGEIDAQSGGPYSNGSLGSTVVMGVDSVVAGGSQLMLGVVTFDGAGNATFSMDENNAGTLTTMTGNGTYTAPDATTGRFTITSPQGTPGLVGYLISANQAFVIGADIGVSAGTFRKQSAGPFTNSSLNFAGFSGDRAFASTPAAPPQGISLATLSTGVVTFDGAANVSLTSDSNESGTLFPGQLSATTYQVLSNGKVTFGSGSTIFYVVSPTELVSMSATTGDPNPKLGFGRQ
jgi:Putative Ig domain